MITPAIERSRIAYSMRNCPTPILQPPEVIQKAVDQHGQKLGMSCSFGSCSVVVLHMALQIDPNIKVVFNNTGVEYPETIQYMKLLREKWNLNLIVTKPIKSFWTCVEEYGFPLMRSAYGYSNKARKGKSYKPECCIYLKELPMKQACELHGIEGTLTGLRCSESGVRMFTLGQRGQYYHTKKWGSLWRFHPIGFWKQKQVWDYLAANQIPTNQVYKKGLDRCGCMPCTSFLNWEQQLSRANLKMYRWVQKLRKIPLLDDFMELENDAYRRGCGSPVILEE